MLIWFFLAGMIAGAVGMVKYAHWWMNRHTTVIKLTKEDIEKMEEKSDD